MRPLLPPPLLLLALTCGLAAQTALRIEPSSLKQKFQGMGCGAIFYEGHITSLAARGKSGLQEELCDAMLKDVRTDFLQLMIRHDQEPPNDNADPFPPRFDPA
ncbi:MAG: hypothetical protein WCH40_06360 [Verrucomicrobiales bacterium]